MAEAYQSQLVRYEQMIYSPVDIDSAKIDGSPIGGDFDRTMAQAIRRGDDHVQAWDGKIITVDVFGKGTNIEVGNTQPINLMTPYLDGLSERAVWVPFPDKLLPNQFNMMKDHLSTVPAFIISFDPE